MDKAAGSAGAGTLIALLVFIAVSVWLGLIAQRVVMRGKFMQGYFLGNRSLGSWALALTATVQSGGTFMGFPSLVYTHGWILTLWIGSYMVVPITGFAVIGKRIAQISRRSGAITMPDLFRARFDSPALGLLTSLLLMFFMSVMMVAQFKAGALVMKLSWPTSGALALSETEGSIDTMYYVGLAIFAATVVGYTLIGGFLAAVWTDLFQSVMMLFGVILLLFLALNAAGGLENASIQAAANTGPGFNLPPGYAIGRAFHPLTLAFSFFVIWPFSGFSSPASVVRVMACRDTATIRRSIFLLSAYNSVIYIPLIMICVCARAVMPDVASSDEVIPRMALWTTSGFPGGSLVAGLILAAPFGAVMSTVSSYLVVIASGLVRDVYQRFFRQNATDREVQLMSYVFMILIGAIAVIANIKPVAFLQTLVVMSSTGAAATFLVPVVMMCYWRRGTALGAVAGMLSGATTIIVLYSIGILSGIDPLIGPAKGLRPYYLLGFDPFPWALLVSFFTSITVSLLTSPPHASLISRLFDDEPTTGA